MQALFLLITVAVLVAILIADFGPRCSTRAPGRRGDTVTVPPSRSTRTGAPTGADRGGGGRARA